MKYLLVLAVVWVAFWVWRNNRLKDNSPAQRPPTPQKPALRQPTVMVACQHCGTHLPEGEAVQGQQGAYCCTDHQRLNEGSPP